MTDLTKTTTTAYRVYEARDGSSPEYVGEYTTLDEARAVAAAEPGGLPESEWGTARAAGHFGGMAAPPNDGTEMDVEGWYGDESWHCVVPVRYVRAAITAASLDYTEDDEHITHRAEICHGQWTVADSSGNRFWPAAPCENEADAVCACRDNAGDWVG